MLTVVGVLWSTPMNRGVETIFVSCFSFDCLTRNTSYLSHNTDFPSGLCSWSLPGVKLHLTRLISLLLFSILTVAASFGTTQLTEE